MQVSDLDFDKSYTYADYLQWTFDDRLKILKGKLFKMTPTPNRMHQRLFGIISRILTGSDEVTTPILPGFVLDLEEVFEEVSL